MNNIFKVYKDKENVEIKKYVIREISKEKSNQMDELHEKEQSVTSKANGPAWLRIIAFIAIWLGIMLVISASNATSESGSSTRIQVIAIVGIAISISGAVIYFYLRSKGKKISNAPETLELVEEINKVNEEALKELQIPSDAIKMDILFVPVKENKDGHIKHNKQMFTYLNQESYVFVEGDNLCFADAFQVLAIKISSLKNIVKINKSIVIPLWNKEKPFNDELYKEFKLKSNNYGMIFVKPYYSVKHDLNGEEYEFLVPNYEINNLLKLVSLDVIDSKEIKK